MISFKTFLLEAEADEAAEAIANKIKQECSKFLSLRTEPLWRGVKLQRTEALKKLDIESIEAFYGKVRQDRAPKDSPKWFHDVLDDYLKEAFGIRFRTESLFCMSSKQGTSIYGTPVAIFPIGDFDYIWSPIIQDPTDDFKTTVHQIRPLPEWKNSEEDFNEIVLSLADEFNFSAEVKKDIESLGAAAALSKHIMVPKGGEERIEFRKRLIELALQKRGKELFEFNKGIDDVPHLHEIMVTCKGYYAIHEDDIRRVQKFL